MASIEVRWISQSFRSGQGSVPVSGWHVRQIRVATLTSKCAFSLTRVGHTQPLTLKSDTLAHARISHMLTHAGNIRRLTRADKSGKLAHSGIYVILNNVSQRASVLLKQQQKHKHGMCTILKGTKFSLNL